MQALTEPATAQSSRQFTNRASLAAGLLSVVGIFGVIAWVVFASTDGAIDVFVDWRGGLVVLAVPLLIMTAIFGWAAPIDAFFYVAGRRNDGGAARDAAHFFQLWAAFALACGFLVTLVGFVVMLANLDDPSKIGPGMAFALMSQLYGVCLAVFCVACSVVILRRYPAPESETRLARQAIVGAGATVVAGTLATLIAFGILMLAFWQTT